MSCDCTKTRYSCRPDQNGGGQGEELVAVLEIVDYKMDLWSESPLGIKTIKAITLQVHLLSMPAVRKPEIVLDSQALKAITIWSTMEDKDPGDLISELILEHMPPRVQDALGLDQNMTTRTKTLKPTEPQKPEATNKPETDTKCHLETEMLECEPEPKKPRKN